MNITQEIINIKNEMAEITAGANIVWTLAATPLIAFMQAGFACIEAGTVKSKNAINILFKNLVDGGISAFTFWLIGYGFAFGETWEGFIGTSNFALTG
jgi:Amt family ammonium transporter